MKFLKHSSKLKNSYEKKNVNESLSAAKWGTLMKLDNQ